MNLIESDICLICGKNTINGWILCGEHTPKKHGDFLLMSGYRKLYLSTVPIRKLFIDIILGYKVILWINGTNALTLVWAPPGYSKFKQWLHKKKYKLIDRFINEYWCVHTRLVNPLTRFGIDENKIKICDRPPEIQGKIKKIEHESFNILFFHPSNSRFHRWLYGVDIYEKVRRE